MYPTHSLAGKLPYSGPTSFRAIVDAIIEDGKAIDLDLSRNFVNRVIRLFFSNIFKQMYKHKYISVEGLGDFGMTQKRKEFLQKRDTRRRLRDRDYKKRKRIAKCYQRRLIKSRMKTLDKMNARRTLINLKPLTLKQYIRFKKHIPPKKLKVDPKFNYTFDILDT